MPFYGNINKDSKEGKWTVERLEALRKDLSVIPERTLDETLILATWNLRDFGAGKAGGRRDEAIQYIAEIIARFDLVALQEVNRSLDDLERLLKALGPSWRYIVTDTTTGRPGNNERVAFVFDRRKVSFGGLAGEVVLPPKRVKKDGKWTYEPVSQLWRTPGISGFRAGWTRFMLCTVHITWGASAKAPPSRVAEIQSVAGYLNKLSKQEHAWARNIILLGDFNIFNVEDETFKALKSAQFEVPEALQTKPSNAKKTRHFDQIAFKTRKGALEPTGQAGVFDFYKSVFRDDDEDVYAAEMGESYTTTSRGNPRTEAQRRTYYQTKWRTFQMSDHLPMWIELHIDHTDAYLAELKASESASSG